MTISALFFGHELFGDLRVEDPRLRRDRRVPVDRKRAESRDLAHHLDDLVPLLQESRELETERGLPDAVRPDEGDFHESRKPVDRKT